MSSNCDSVDLRLGILPSYRIKVFVKLNKEYVFSLVCLHPWAFRLIILSFLSPGLSHNVKLCHHHSGTVLLPAFCESISLYSLSFKSQFCSVILPFSLTPSQFILVTQRTTSPHLLHFHHHPETRLCYVTSLQCFITQNHSYVMSFFKWCLLNKLIAEHYHLE